MWKPGGAYQESVEYEDQVSTRAGTRTEIVKGTVKPDSLFVVRDRARRIHYFPEADRSTMTNARYLKKLKDYYAYWLTYVKDNPESPIKPMRVLTITRSEERKKNLRKIADTVSDEAKNLFWFICEKSYLGQPHRILEDTWQTLEDPLEDKNETFRRLYPHE